MKTDNTYTKKLHEHRLAAWAASRAASTSPKCRFKVKKGFTILENSGFDESFVIDEVCTVEKVDALHKQWRLKVIEVANSEGLEFSHGVAAKLINCYIKTRFVCGGLDDEKIKNLHPPVDSILLENLRKLNKKVKPNPWKEYCEKRWSKFDSETYENVIKEIRKMLDEEPMWMIEKYWNGYNKN